MSHFVNEAMKQGVIWGIEERGKRILDILGSTIFDHDKKKVDYLGCLAELPVLRLRLEAHNNQAGKELTETAEEDTLRDIENYKNKPGMVELRHLIDEHIKISEKGGNSTGKLKKTVKTVINAQKAVKGLQAGKDNKGDNGKSTNKLEKTVKTVINTQKAVKSLQAGRDNKGANGKGKDARKS